MGGALDGIRVLGFTHFAQAPLALQLLGDLGADVINIERPQGEHERGITNHEKVNGESIYFLAMNRNKRCLTLDLKQEEAKEIVKKLLKNTDVVVSNFRVGVMDKLGFSYEEIKKINPDIIYAEALGYGRSGPYRDRPGQDLLAQCISGYATLVGTEDNPMPGGAYLVDAYSSAMLVSGILAALYDLKAHGGGGQIVSVNLLDSAIHIQAQEFSYYLNSGEVPRRAKTQGGHVHMKAPYAIYRTAEGYMAISVTNADRAEQLGEILGVPGMKEIMPDDDSMQTNKDAIFEVIQAALMNNTADFWVKELLDHGFWSAKLNEYPDVENDPQVIHNEIIQEMDHPIAGKIRVVGPGIYLSKTPATIRKRPPLLGEHTVEILKEIGYDDQKIAELKDEHVF